MTHVFWLLHLMCGWMTDARMWGDKEKDWPFLKQYVDVYWLFWYNAGSLITWTVSFIYWLTTLMPIYSWQQIVYALPAFVGMNAAVGFGMSVFWDLGFTKNETGAWVRAIPKWLTIPNPFSKKKDPLEQRWVIGFTEREMWWFNGVRVVVLVATVIR